MQERTLQKQQEGLKRLKRKLRPGHTLETVVEVDFTRPGIAEKLSKGLEQIKKDMDRVPPSEHELSQLVINP